METEKLISLINEKEIMSIDGLCEFFGLSEESVNKLEVKETIDTNPRRDYLGEKQYIHNKHDDRYFYIETYGNDMGWEFYECGEVKPVKKEVTVWEEI